MKNYQVFSGPIIYLLSVCFVLSIAACDSDNVEEELFSGKELFEAFLFGERGEVTDKLPELFGPAVEITESQIRQVLTAAELAELDSLGVTIDDLKRIGKDLAASLTVEQEMERQRVMREIITFIENRDGAFFDRFAEEVQSGNQLRVERALEEAGELFKIALKELYDVDLDEYLVYRRNPPSLTVVMCGGLCPDDPNNPFRFMREGCAKKRLWRWVERIHHLWWW